MGLRKIIEDYLKEVRLMSLATSLDNQPWVCSVWFAADADLNIYYFSATARRHSEEIVKNNKVAGAIVLPQSPKDPPRGLYFQGTAELLHNQDDIDEAISVYADRIFPKKKIKEFMNNKEKQHKFYRIKPTSFVLFDAVNFPNNPRQEFKL